jgi:hypothetical protein
MNVQEILNINKERKIKTKEAIEKIISHIHKKIRYNATMKKESCIYIIPPIINECPIYDFEIVIKDIFKILDSEGYIVAAFSDGRLEINWNEKLVEQKAKTDAYVLSNEERKLKNITKKIKKVDERYQFLANPLKTTHVVTQEQELDEQVEKILKEKKNQQKKFKDIVGKFNK